MGFFDGLIKGVGNAFGTIAKGLGSLGGTVLKGVPTVLSIAKTFVPGVSLATGVAENIIGKITNFRKESGIASGLASILPGAQDKVNEYIKQLQKEMIAQYGTKQGPDAPGVQTASTRVGSTTYKVVIYV